MSTKILTYEKEFSKSKANCGFSTANIIHNRDFHLTYLCRYIYLLIYSPNWSG